MSNGKANLALSLIGYEAEVSAAMAYVFGTTLICDDAETAKKVAFHKDIKMKSVTLQGDVYNPSGTLEGGSAPQSDQILVRIQNLKKLEADLAKAQADLTAADTQYQSVQTQLQRLQQAQNELELKRHEIAGLEGRVAESNATRVRQ